MLYWTMLLQDQSVYDMEVSIDEVAKFYYYKTENVCNVHALVHSVVDRLVPWFS